jgi:hypothetical protein
MRIKPTGISRPMFLWLSAFDGRYVQDAESASPEQGRDVISTQEWPVYNLAMLE